MTAAQWLALLAVLEAHPKRLPGWMIPTIEASWRAAQAEEEAEESKEGEA